jgi:hypothetical protein
MSKGNGLRGETSPVAYHAGKLSITTVGSWLAVATKSSNLGKVEVEFVLQPVDSIPGTASQDGDKVVTSKVTSLRNGLVTKTVCMEFRLTDFLVSSKKILELSWMPRSCWLWVPAPLIPEVALVEFPPINLNDQGRQ